MAVGLSERHATDRRVITERARPEAPALVRSRRPRFDSWWPIVVSAALAVSIVSIVERVGPSASRPVPESTTADEPTWVPANRDDAFAAPTGASAGSTAAIESHGMELRLTAGTAELAVGRSSSIELTTTRIGDLVLADGVLPAVEQRDGELVSVWDDVSEWYRTRGSGFEHGYTIDRSLHTDQTLTIDVAVNGAEVGSVGGDLLFARDGEPPVWYRDLHAFDADGTALPATMAPSATGITIEIDTTAATYPITVDPIITEDQRIDPEGGPGLNAEFGSAVAVDGNRMVVTAPGGDPAGLLYVYERTAEGQPWVLDATIENPGQPPTGSYLYDGSFGSSVDILGDQIAVAASDHFLLGEPGTAWLFTRVGPGNWGEPQAIPQTGFIDEFGASIAIVETDRVLIGAPRNTPTFPGGAVYEWTPEGGLVALETPDSVPADSRYGTSIAVDARPGGGHRLAVGAPAQEPGGGVYVFQDTGAGFEFTRGFSGFIPATADIGTSVDVSGDTVVVAGYGDGSAGSSIRVHVLTALNGGASWFTDVVLSGGSTEGFVHDPLTSLPINRYVDVEGGTIALAQPGEDGRVQIFRYDGQAWGLAVDELEPASSSSGDRFGWSIAIDNETAIAGAPGAAAAYSFEIPAVTTFDGSAFGAWEDPANWDLDLVPDADDVAIVPTGQSTQLAEPASVAGLFVGGEVRVLDLLDVTTRAIVSASGTVTVGVGSPAELRLPPTLTMDGRLALASGSHVATAGNLELAETSVIDVELDPVTETSGTISIAGTLIQAGTLVATNAGAVDPADEYTVFTCVYCVAGQGFSTQTIGSLDIVQHLNGLRLVTIDGKFRGVGQRFGQSVDVDGNLAIVGGQGRAELLRRDFGTGAWSVIGTFTDPSPGYGRSVRIMYPFLAIASDTTVFTYEIPSDPATESFDTTGSWGTPGPAAIDLFDFRVAFASPSGDIQVWRLYNDGNPGSTGPSPDLVVSHFVPGTEIAPGAQFGASIALGGEGAFGDSWVAVGAPVPDGGGQVFVLDQTAGVWATTADVITSPDGGARSEFGRSVAAWVDRLVVGEPLNNATAFDAGAAWVYEAPSDPSPQRLLASDGEILGLFGSAVAIDGNTIVVGSPLGSTPGAAYREGSAFVFKNNGSAWEEIQVLRAADGFVDEQFGAAVGVWGDDVLVGAPFDTNSNGFQTGAAYTFVASEPTGLSFGLDLAGPVSQVPVAPTGIAVNRFNRSLVESQSTSTVAASSISTIDLAETSLAAVPIGATPLSAIVLDSAPLSAIPLVQIDVDGGWADIIAGSALEAEPFSSLTFGDVLSDDEVASTIAALPLSAIDVRGTPLSAIPLSAVALGATPLSAIPLSAIDQGDNQSPWCPIIASLIPAGSSCAQALEDLNLMEVTLRGVPLSAIPLSAIPLSAIDLSEAPLSAIPLSAISLETSPLSAIPLSAIPLSAIGPSAAPLSAIPLSAIPLSAIPLSAIPLSAIDVAGSPLSAIPLSAIPLSAIPTSIPLSAIPLSAIEANGTPLSAIQVQGAPLSAIPLSAIFLADTPLSAIPLSAIGGSTDWCDVLASTSYNCESGVDPQQTTLRELSLRGVPLSAIPLSAIPLSAIPLSAIGPSAAPLSAIPLSAIPLSAIELNGTPLSAIPLSAIDVSGSPLSAIPLSAIPLSAIGPAGAPLSAIPLSAIPLSAIPLSAIPLSAIDVMGTPLSAIPLSAIDVLSTPLSAIPLSAIPLSAIDCTRVDCTSARLGDAIRRRAVDLGAVPLSAIQPATSGIRLGDIADAFDIGRDGLRAVIDASQRTLGDLNGVDDLTLGDLPANVTAQATLGQLLAALSSVTFGDLVAALDDPTAGAVVRQAIDARNETLGDLDSLGDVTLGDLIADGGPPLDLADLGPVLGFITVQSIVDAVNGSIGAIPGLLGDLSPEELGQLTLADLVDAANYQGVALGELLEELDLAGALEGFTLADLLIALIDPASQAFGGFRFEQVDVGALPAGTVEGVGFRADFALSGSIARTVEVSVTLPSSASYVPGSSTLGQGEVAGTPIADPAISGSLLTWRVLAEPGLDYVIEFDVLPAVRLGATTLAATATVLGTDIQVFGSASVQVVEGLEPNDYPSTTPASDDTIYLTYISTPTDRDVFEIQLQENDRLLVELSNLDADLDMALYAATTSSATGASLSRVGDQPPLIPITDPDADGADSEPLDDFPRLDLLFPDDGLELVKVANRSGTGNETLSTGRLPAGTYYLQVHGVNGAVNVSPASLQLKVVEAESRPVCAATGPLAPAVPGVAPTLSGLTGNTLFLVNEMRLEQLHGADGRATVMDALDDLVTYLEGNPALGIDPIVVPVDGFPAVRGAYDEWDDPANPADACDPARANAVVSAINSTIVDELRDQLDHIVVVGGDDIIPMARLLDRTATANEYDFRHEFDGLLAGGAGTNAFTATFWTGHFLSDEPYGEAAARSLGDRHLYVTDVALGRLVETPDEIADALEKFVTFEGWLDVSTATVLGYDFLSDGSRAVADTLEDALGPANVDDELAEGLTAAGAPWGRIDAENKLAAAATNSLVSLNAHFDHYRALPAIGDRVPNFDDNLVAENVLTLLGDDALAQSLVFSMGCHSGLSVSDVMVAANNADWAESMSQLGALYVGNTGFGYGDTVRVAYTEELMALFAEEVTRPLDLDGSGVATTVGQALAYAKNRYVAENGVFSVYDEKAVMESTFYGLPFYRVGLAPVEPPAVPDNVTTPDVTGTPSLHTAVTATNDPVQTDRGTYYANVVDGVEQAIVAPGRPIQPKVTTDVSVVEPGDTSELAEVAAGAIVLGMESRWVSLPDPVIATPTFDLAEGAPEPAVDDDVFPARPVTINTVTEPGGQRQRLVVATGQYRSSEAIQRLDDRLDLVVYYRDPTETDVLPPVIAQVDSTLTEGQLTVQVSASDAANAVDRVYVLVAENPGSAPVVWRGLDLTQVDGRWVGSLALTPGTTDVEFIVQVKDAVGNVGYATNKARNFLTSATPPPPPPPPTVLTATVTTPAAPSGWYDGDVTVEVTSNATATYSIDGGPAEPVPSDGTFVVSGDGPHTWRVETETGWSASGTVRIDTDGSPRITVATPIEDGVYPPGGAVIDVACQDVSLVACDISVDGQPVANGSPLPSTPGEHELTIVATDSLGHSSSTSVAFTVRSADVPPVIDSVSWPDERHEITDSATVVVRFSDESLPFDSHTVTIEWGDGTSSTVVGAPAGSDVTRDHLYTAPGDRTITVTVTDADGQVDVESFDLVVADTTAHPVVVSQTWPATPQRVGSTIEVTATFTDASMPFDAHTATIEWGESDSEPVAVPVTPSASGGSVATEHVYDVNGVYPVTLTIIDVDGNTVVNTIGYVVVYDPGAGQVSGSGTFWVDSDLYGPRGKGKGTDVHFGYDARYKRTTSVVPEGGLSMHRKGEFRFESTAYDYLIINDSIAVAEGAGTLNGTAGYRFRVQGADLGSSSYFQITIWSTATGQVVYDNGVLFQDESTEVLLGGIRIET